MNIYANVPSRLARLAIAAEMTDEEIDRFLRQALLSDWDRRMHDRDAKRMHIWTLDRLWNLTPAESIAQDNQVLEGFYAAPN
jgi:hypothetical protein